MSQLNQIKLHLENGNSLTPIEALELFGCFRLAARILELKESGMNILTEKVERNGKHFAKYLKVVS